MTTLFLLRERVRRQVLTIAQIESRIENLGDCRLEIAHRLTQPHDPETNDHTLLHKSARLLLRKQRHLEVVAAQRRVTGEAAVARQHALAMLEAPDVA